VIPMYNPGSDITECLESVVRQTLPRDRIEIVVVDDGSTDSSPARVAAFSARHPGLVTMQRTEPSGGPSRPRNIGIDLARGRFIHFVDSDDTLAPRALERLLEVADTSNADIVLGKISSGGPRDVYHPLFRRTVTSQTFADLPTVVQSGAPYKLIRREFLVSHAIRFPEGRAFIEDQYVCARAYAHATSIAVVSDLVCYFHWRRRTTGEHFGDTQVEPTSYAAELATIFDVVDNETPESARTYVAARYYRIEMLGRLRGPAMLGYDEDYRRELLAAMRGLAEARVSAAVRDGIPAFPRAQSRLLQANDHDGLLTYARIFDSIRMRATAEPPTWDRGVLVLTVNATLYEGDGRLHLETDGEHWLLPERLAPGTDATARRVTTAELAGVDLDCASVARIDGQLWSNTDGLHLAVADDGEVRISGTVRIDPTVLAGGQPCPDGLWDLRLRVRFAGLSRTSPLRGDQPSGPASTWISTGTTLPRSVTAYWTAGEAPALALDVGAWMHPLHDLVDLESASIDDQGSLRIAAPRIYGDSAIDAAVTVVPVQPSTESAVQCLGHLRLGPEGSAVEVPIPELPGTDERRLLLRIGPLGGAPPIELPALSVGSSP
jgi:poly(ribitol-phosphate) beta-N-acetylglucosaminyltransferase